MISTTGLTQFIANQNRTAGQRHVIVKLTDGTSTWLVAQVPMVLTDGFVYPVLNEMSAITASANPLTKEWSVGDVTITLINQPYRDSDTMRNLRPSDEMAGIIGKEVYIYLMAGQCSALSECLLRFWGRVEDIGNYTSEKFEILCVDRSREFNKIIPSTYFTQDEEA